MPKPKTVDEKPGIKKSLPEVCEQEFEGSQEAVLLLEEGLEVTQLIGKVPDKKKDGDRGKGLLGRLAEIKEQLSGYVLLYGLNGLRHNKIVFTDRWTDGRNGLNPEKLKLELCMELSNYDVPNPAQLVEKCIERATVQGDGFYTRELSQLED